LDDIFRSISKAGEKEAMLLARKGDYEKALEILEPIYLDNPDDPRIISEYLWILLRLEKNKEALAIFDGLSSKTKEEIYPSVVIEFKGLHIKKQHQLAVELARSEKYSEAIEILDKLISEKPSEKLFKADKVLVLLWKGEENQALAFYEEYFGKNADAPEYLLKKINTINARIVKDNESSALESKSQSTEKNLSDKIDSENVPEGKIVVEEPAKDERTISSIHEESVALARASDFSSAIKMFEELMKMEGGRTDKTISDYIVVLCWSGRYQDAVGLFERESASFKLSDYVYKNIAASYYRLEKYPESLKFYRKAIEIDPMDVESIKGVALSMFKVEGEDAALSFVAEESGKMENDPILGEKIRAELYKLNGKTAEALSEIEKIIEREPSNLNAKIAKADILVGMKDSKSLASLLEELEKEHPLDPYVLIFKVYCHQLMKEYFKAYDEVERILSINPNFQPAINARYHILLDIRAAQIAQEKLIESKEKVGLEIEKRII